MSGTPPYTTSDAGIPATSDEHSLTVGPDGPDPAPGHYLVQKMQHFNRERVPERVVHAKGGGAYGFFETTEDVSSFTKAALFQPGARTDLLVRFSTVAGELGSPDTARDPRGFAVKFYTEQGNYDMVGNNTPVFFIRDPQKFQDFIHSQKRRADNHLRDNNMQWDFWTLSPESAHQVTMPHGRPGHPPERGGTWTGYSSHTYMWINAGGERFWVKYHFKTDQGNEFLTNDEAAAIAAADPDAHIRDLYETIGRGEHPSWTLSVQVMPFDEAAGYRFNPFDLTKVWPHADYPLHPGGPDGARPQPGELLRRDRAGDVRAVQHGARDRAVAGQDAARSAVQLPRHPPAPGRCQRPAAPGQPTPLAGALLQPRRADALREPARPGLRAELLRRPRPHNRERFGADPSWAVDRRDRARRLPSCTPRTTTSARPGPWCATSSTTRHGTDSSGTSSRTSAAGVVEPVLARVKEYWRHVDPGLGARVAKELES